MRKLLSTWTDVKPWIIKLGKKKSWNTMTTWKSDIIPLIYICVALLIWYFRRILKQTFSKAFQWIYYTKVSTIFLMQERKRGWKISWTYQNSGEYLKALSRLRNSFKYNQISITAIWLWLFTIKAVLFFSIHKYFPIITA